MSQTAAEALRCSYETEIDEVAESAGKRMEQGLGYFVEDGRYWKQMDRFDPSLLRQLDEAWLSSVRRIIQPLASDGLEAVEFVTAGGRTP